MAPGLIIRKQHSFPLPDRKQHRFEHLKHDIKKKGQNLEGHGPPWLLLLLLLLRLGVVYLINLIKA